MPKAKTRIYRSPLRDARAAETRERILEGLVRVMGRDGISDLSIPLVASEAGVSIPTVYRYFPTKRDLFAALDEYAHRKGSFSFEDFGPIETPDQLADTIPEAFKRRESIEATLSAAMSSRLGYAIRRTEFLQRAKFFSKVLRPASKHLSRQEQRWLRDVIFVLDTYATVRAFRDYLGLDSQEAAKRVAWAIRTLARATKAGKRKPSSVSDGRSKKSK